MLASSVAPIRTGATLAAAVDPMAAEKTLQNAISGLDVSGWAAAGAEIPSPRQTTPKAAPVNVRPKAEPVMTEELMERMIKVVRDQTESGAIDVKICKIFDLCDGTKDMPVMLGISDSTDGQHYFAVPLKIDSKDIIIAVKHTTVIEAYLTDKTGKLRAAAVLENGSAHLITNEKAATKFEAELSLFAGEAAALPPTGTAVPGNS
ncbi:MAG: hypothetical protein PHS14_10380 [Elusimicrobia bacterium]|nr:hypothetical protein [Elusimicrobiota bacterium]